MWDWEADKQACEHAGRQEGRRAGRQAGRQAVRKARGGMTAQCSAVEIPLWSAVQREREREAREHFSTEADSSTQSRADVSSVRATHR